MDQQRVEHTNGTVDWANPVYEPKLVYYHLATDMRTGRQNLYRQIRTQPGLRSTDEIVAENVSNFTLAYLDKDNNPVDCLSEPACTNKLGLRWSGYPFGIPAPLSMPTTAATPWRCTTRLPCNSGLSPDPLKNIRRITVSLTTMPAGATTLTALPPPRETPPSRLPARPGSRPPGSSTSSPFRGRMSTGHPRQL